MDRINYAKAILKEWNNFQAGKNVDKNIVDAVIFESWLRCKSHGLDPGHLTRKYISPGELAKKQEAQAILINAVSYVIEELLEDATLSDIIANLYDTDGILLYSYTKSTSVKAFPLLRKGLIVNEDISGTNAVSICLQEKRLTETCGADHFFSVFHNYFCSAIPIMLRKKVVGVLNFLMPLQFFDSHLRILLNITCRAISERMAFSNLSSEQDQLLDMLDKAMVFFDEKGEIQKFTKKARDLYQDDMPDNIRKIISSCNLSEILSPKSNKFTPINIHQVRNDRQKLLFKSLSLGDTNILLLQEQEKSEIDKSVSEYAKKLYTFDNIIGHSPQTTQLIKLGKIAAQCDITTLIEGESGTGKEVIAQAIHSASSRAAGPFVAVNCGAFPPELIQSELFGYDEGAFTGASKYGKPGKFELANNGTIFLDEIGEMSLLAQVSLLRIIQSGEIIRIGGKTTKKINVRIIAATNKNLFNAIKKGEFREDLFYRINVFPIHMPPLRSRQEDICEIAHHVLKRCDELKNASRFILSEETLQIFKHYNWPGNIRELENIIKRMAVIAESNVLGKELIPAYILDSVNVPNKKESSSSLSGAEKELILNAIKSCFGNLKAAASALGISRSGLYAKMRRLNITPEESRQYGSQSFIE